MSVADRTTIGKNCKEIKYKISYDHIRCSDGGAENAGRESDGREHEGHENAEPEIAGHENAGMK